MRAARSFSAGDSCTGSAVPNRAHALAIYVRSGSVVGPRSRLDWTRVKSDPALGERDEGRCGLRRCPRREEAQHASRGNVPPSTVPRWGANSLRLRFPRSVRSPVAWSSACLDCWAWFESFLNPKVRRPLWVSHICPRTNSAERFGCGGPSKTLDPSSCDRSIGICERVGRSARRSPNPARGCGEE